MTYHKLGDFRKKSSFLKVLEARSLRSSSPLGERDNLLHAPLLASGDLLVIFEFLGLLMCHPIAAFVFMQLSSCVRLCPNSLFL